MITIPQLDAVSNILDTDVIIVAHANGNEAFRLTGANLKAAIRANRCDLYNNNNLNVSDCNNLPEGFYSARGLDNRPSAVSSGSWAVYFTQLLNNNPLYKKQICIHGANATISLRGCNNGTWSDWNVVGLPVMPASDGNYILQCVIANGVPTYSWSQGTTLINFTSSQKVVITGSNENFCLLVLMRARNQPGYAQGFYSGYAPDPLVADRTQLTSLADENSVFNKTANTLEVSTTNDLSIVSITPIFGSFSYQIVSSNRDLRGGDDSETGDQR